MNYSLNRETLVCLMAFVMVTKGVWQPARTHKQKQRDLGQDGASSGGYATLSMIEERYVFLQSLCELCFSGLQQPPTHRHQYRCHIISILHLRQSNVSTVAAL